MSAWGKQFSAMEKINCRGEINAPEIESIVGIAGERISYQVVFGSNNGLPSVINVQSSLGDAVRVYAEKEVFVDRPFTRPALPDSDYLIEEPGFLPDVLIPLEDQRGMVSLMAKHAVLWVRIDLPKDLPAGEYTVTISCGLHNFESIHAPYADEATVTMRVQVAEGAIKDPDIRYTRWFYADCIANAHGVAIYSEAHWNLIEQYIAAATDVGINMILLPVHTPPLDTEIDTARPCVQLVDITKNESGYTFGFEKLERFVSICKKNGVRYYEMAHLFTQWGAEAAPNIEVTVNGKKQLYFGWHTPARAPEYVAFLKEYIAAIVKELKRLGIAENTYFHISDEPQEGHMEKFREAYDVVKPLIAGSRHMDALSHVSFYEKGLIECPVTAIHRINEFLRHDIPEKWTYYCCEPQDTYPNSFLAFPLYRVRILGYLMYKYNIKGFLHWGYNFYNTVRSHYPINPYLNTSADGIFPSGDGFIVYPGPSKVYSSMRGEMTFRAMQDIGLCLAAEEKIGRAAVVAILDGAFGEELRFEKYPRENGYFDRVTQKLLQAISQA